MIENRKNVQRPGSKATATPMQGGVRTVVAAAVVAAGVAVKGTCDWPGSQD